MTKEIICTVCPMGCHITVEGEGDQVTSISGFTCKRGETYGRQEFAHPVRILITTVKTDQPGHELLAVRSSVPVPKERLFDCMEVIRQTTVQAPVKRYDVVIKDICGTGADIVATGMLEVKN